MKYFIDTEFIEYPNTIDLILSLKYLKIKIYAPYRGFRIK